MSKFIYSDEEQKFNNILTHQTKELDLINRPDMSIAEERIEESEKLLRELGYTLTDLPIIDTKTKKQTIVVPKWEDLVIKAECEVGSMNELDALFTNEELELNQKVIQSLQDDFNNIHKLDKIDISICAGAGILAAIVDILNGKMTTIDKTGKIVSQFMNNYTDRKESDIFAAIAKQIIHFKSDITTSMGLPAPLMGLFNLLQFGKIGDEDQTIAEIVQGMYYEGYDFIHFSSMAISTMIIEVIIRIGYALKKINEGHSIKNSIPFSLDKEKYPKLHTMLFIGHSIAASANAGKIYFTKNPMTINYAQWITFAKYSYSHLKWVLIEKSELRASYVSDKIYKETQEVYEKVNLTFNNFSNDRLVIFD